MEAHRLERTDFVWTSARDTLPFNSITWHFILLFCVSLRRFLAIWYAGNVIDISFLLYFCCFFFPLSMIYYCWFSTPTYQFDLGLFWLDSSTRLVDVFYYVTRKIFLLRFLLYLLAKDEQNCCFSIQDMFAGNDNCVLEYISIFTGLWLWRKYIIINKAWEINIKKNCKRHWIIANILISTAIWNCFNIDA